MLPGKVVYSGADAAENEVDEGRIREPEIQSNELKEAH